MLKRPIPISFGLNSQQSFQSVCAVIHIDDKNTETLDLSLMQSGEHIAVSSNSTVTARFVRVKDKILISDNVPCAVQENGNILIPIDNAAAHMLVGEIKIEVNIVDENDVLTMQFPLVIRVNNTILADAEISPESEGTIPELLEEAKEAAESATQAAEAATEAISTKQDKLTAGENITIEDNVISATGGSNDYTELENKPSINNVTLSGNKTSDDLSLQGKLTAGNNITINNGVISASGGVTDYAQLSNLPKILYRKSTSIFAFGDLIGELKSQGGIYFTKNNNGYYIQVDPDKVFMVKHYDTFPLNSVEDNTRSFVLIANHFNDLPNFVTNRPIFVQYSAMDPYTAGCVQFLYWRDSNGKLHTAQRINTQSTLGTWEEVSSGSQIVSGVVNVNGTITFTDSEGNTFTTSGESVIGAEGFSPVATVQQTASGATITVTDKNGTTTANISNGAPGQDYILTEQDKDDIADIVLSELPTTEGVLYGN